MSVEKSEMEAKKRWLAQPSGAPFRWSAWLELPFPVFVRIDNEFDCKYKDCYRSNLRIEFFTDVRKLATGNSAQRILDTARWYESVRDGKHTLRPRGWRIEYLRLGEIEKRIEELKAKGEEGYFHLDDVPSAVRLSAALPAPLNPLAPTDPLTLFPDGDFLSREVFPRLQAVLDAYRISVFPPWRYSVQPLSEVLVGSAFIYLADKNGEIIAAHVGFFDRFTPRPYPEVIQESLKDSVQSRFAETLANLDALSAENEFASTYFLFRMRRWTEALTLASSVVDKLIQELVHALVQKEEVAGLLLNPLRYKELFNKVFPSYGKEKLSECNPKLWAAFVEARDRRGNKVHGGRSQSYSPEEREKARGNLTAFYGIAQWLAEQLGREWKLEMQEEGNPLEPFPK